MGNTSKRPSQAKPPKQSQNIGAPNEFILQPTCVSSGTARKEITASSKRRPHRLIRKSEAVSIIWISNWFTSLAEIRSHPDAVLYHENKDEEAEAYYYNRHYFTVGEKLTFTITGQYGYKGLYLWSVDAWDRKDIPA
jgi:hypothetical protein